MSGILAGGLFILGPSPWRNVSCPTLPSKTSETWEQLLHILHHCLQHLKPSEPLPCYTGRGEVWTPVGGSCPLGLRLWRHIPCCSIKPKPQRIGVASPHLKQPPPHGICDHGPAETWKSLRIVISDPRGAELPAPGGRGTT